MKQDTIGVGITTCNRPDMLEVLLESLNSCKIDHVVIINDGDDPVDSVNPEYVVINNETNLGVGKCKNILLDHLTTECDVEHIFLIEDDMVVLDPDVFSVYINTSKSTNIPHLNFCLHGEDNKKDGEANPKLIIDYGDVCVSLYHNIYGALSYYHADVIQEIGLMDEQYNNAMEHVDHTMQIIKAGLHPPFRWFVDVTDSDKLITDQDDDHQSSVIRKDDDWMENFRHGVERFYNKFDINVCGNNQQCATKEQTIECLKQIKSDNE